MKSRSGKAKGRRLVSELREAILQAFPALQPDDIQPVPTSVGGEDLKLSPAARKYWPFSVECKNQEKLNIHEAVSQAERNAKDNVIPIVVFRRNHSKPWVAINLEDLLTLMIERKTNSEALADLFQPILKLP
jgi:hypothetical protein